GDFLGGIVLAQPQQGRQPLVNPHVFHLTAAFLDPLAQQGIKGEPTRTLPHHCLSSWCSATHRAPSILRKNSWIGSIPRPRPHLPPALGVPAPRPPDLLLGGRHRAAERLQRVLPRPPRRPARPPEAHDALARPAAAPRRPLRQRPPA